jgi:hypothetical protein
MCWHLFGLASLSGCQPLLLNWCRAQSPSHAVVVELQGLLLARERELDRREGAIAAWEDGFAAFERTLEKVLIECQILLFHPGMRI